jgi:anti-sigma B factor antagonist
MSKPAFQIREREIGRDIHVIEGDGELDLQAAPELRQRLLDAIDAGKTRLVFDLSGATFVDSTAIGVLALGCRRLRPDGGKLAVVCTDENILETFQMIGLERVLPLHTSLEEALVELAGVPSARV